MFSQTSDEALGTDVILIAQEITNDCVDNMAHNPIRGGPWSGGSRIFGELVINVTIETLFDFR